MFQSLVETSLRSKRFQSSYCSFFFCSCLSFLDEPREETLATQAGLKHMRGSRYTSGVIRGCHTDFLARRFYLELFFLGGGGVGVAITSVYCVCALVRLVIS